MSRRRLEYSTYTDADIQNQYAAADAKLKACYLDYDAGKLTDDDLEAFHALLYKLDDELCARGL